MRLSKPLLTLVALSLTIALSAQESGNRREGWHPYDYGTLYGDVARVDVVVYEAHKEGESIIKGEPNYRAVYIFDSRGNVVESHRGHIEDNAPDRYYYEYDNSGNLVSYKAFLEGSDEPNCHYTYEYDSQEMSETTEAPTSEEEAPQWLYTYDIEGRIIESSYEDEHNIFTLDSQGNATQILNFIDGRLISLVSLTITYN